MSSALGSLAGGSGGGGGGGGGYQSSNQTSFGSIMPQFNFSGSGNMGAPPGASQPDSAVSIGASGLQVSSAAASSWLWPVVIGAGVLVAGLVGFLLLRRSP